ncbi:apolipoprotein D-like isoform X3 [Toxorhynchites rutilus septentrionalis]|uniref:apolipoprotein D-like isoform X3 n=1 Tax=Toxorhynchites rutilus septentrionalis TaxID=329112 RepID=UPI002478350C|nr:apolipoprotein D-like isoform X3 [Toxorhynchites rutilus septentrionalis]
MHFRNMTKQRRNSVILLLLSVGAIPTSGQIASLGKCPDVTVEKDFNPKAYLGRWYEQEKYPFVFELIGRCVIAEYGLNTDGTISVTNQQSNMITGDENSIYGSARIVQPAKLAVKFPVPLDVEAPYWVLGTDYKNYAVVLSCIDFGGLLNTKVVWILTRKRYPEIEIMEKAYSVLDAARLSRSYLTRTDQKNCAEIKEKNVMGASRKGVYE